MSAPNVFRRPGEDYHEARVRAGQMNRAIAEALGWRIETRKFNVSPQQAYRELEASRGMFGEPDAPSLLAGEHIEPFWVDETGKEYLSFLFSNANEALPDWQGDLNKAWELHALRPDGTMLFALSWLELPPTEVAHRICEAFLKWKREARA